MTGEIILAIAVVTALASGSVLLLPHRHGAALPRRVHALGLVLCVFALGLLASFWKPPGEILERGFFTLFGFVALLAGVLMITSRDPIFSALWFALVVLCTAGLFLLGGSQFLAAGTVIVYAGAIIVMFLFVIMLAQPEGRAVYDRMSRAPRTTAFTTFLLFWTVIYGVLSLKADRSPGPEESRLVARQDILAGAPESPRVQNARLVLDRSVPPSVRLPETPANTNGDNAENSAPAPRLAPSHVAGLGGTLFTDYLIAVELAAVLLFVSMIAAVAITIAPGPGHGHGDHGKPSAGTQRPPTGSTPEHNPSS